MLSFAARSFFLCFLRNSLENNFLRAVPKSQSQAQHVSCHQITQLISLDIFQSHLVVVYLLTQTANALFSLFFFPPQNTPAHGYILNLYLLIFFFHFCLCQQCCISHSRHFSVSNLSAEVLKQKPTKCVCRLSISCHQSISA